MNGNYTQEAQDKFFALFDHDSAQIWDVIDQLTTQTQTDHSDNQSKWMQRLETILAEYKMSSRFFLMRMLDENATIEQALTLPQEGWDALMQTLLDKASKQPGFDEARDSAAICLALSTDRQKKPIARKDAFILGHALRFELPQMQAFLLRTSDMESGFRFNCSGDLIEAYVFLTGGSAACAQALKLAYECRTSGIEKIVRADNSISWTQDADDSLPGLITTWGSNMDAAVDWHAFLSRHEADQAKEAGLDQRDFRFLQWLEERAPYLDVPSHTATHIYRELAAYAYALVSGTVQPPAESQLLNTLRRIVSSRETSAGTIDLLYENGVVSQHKCDALAKVLHKNNVLLSLGRNADLTHSWHYLRVNGVGEVSASINQNERNRLRDLLTGTVHIEKPDMLYLLWFVANWCWFVYTASTAVTASHLFIRLADFMQAAEETLQAALLPEFYPPHLLEQSMMLAIVHSGAVREDPAVVYEEICAATIKERNRTSKSGAAQPGDKSAKKKAGTKKTSGAKKTSGTKKTSSSGELT